MNTLVKHDLRCGLIRWPYLLTPVFFAPALFFVLSGAWEANYTDFLMSVFEGGQILPPDALFGVPLGWVVPMSGCLLINLGYFLQDLTGPGHQVLLRSGTKRGWFLSKCLWNLLSCLVYFAVFLFMALVFELLKGGELLPLRLGEVVRYSHGRMFRQEPTAAQIMVITVFLPFLTVFAFSLLQMVLCLFIRPILAFLACISLMMLSVAVASPFMLGNGAMWLRNRWMYWGELRTGELIIGCLLWIAVSFAAGLIRIKHVDVLGTKE